MWREEKEWLHYLKNIIASDIPSAVFLAAFLKHSTVGDTVASSVEIIDLQKYKVIKNVSKVKVSLRERYKAPFIFTIYKN